MGVLTVDAETAPLVGRVAARRIVAAGTLVCLAAALAWVGPRHEPWFDEAQAWLLARDSTLSDLLLERLRYEGSPGLWHALLWGLIRLGLPFSGLWLVSSTLALAGSALLLLRAPFPTAMRVGCVLSYVFAYQYAVVARSYALDLVLLPLVAVLFADRLRRPLAYAGVLGLLANANAHGFLVAGVLAAEFGLARLRRRDPVRWPDLLAAALYGILALAAARQAWPAPDVSFAAAARATPDGMRALGQIAEAFIDRADIVGPGLFTGVAPTSLAIMGGLGLSLAALVPSLVLFRRAGTLPLFGALALVLCGFAVVQWASAWHAGLLFLAWTICLWVNWDAVRSAPVGLRRALVGSIGLILAVQGCETVLSWRREVAAPYSAGARAAALMADLRLRRPETRIAGLGFKTLAVQPYFDRNAFANSRTPDVSFFVWRGAGSIPAAVDAGSLAAVLGSERYDAVLVSTATDTDIAPIALRAGYCVATSIAAR